MPIPLRPDFDAMRLRGLARESKDAKQVRRLLALAAIYGEAIRTEAARIGGVTLQIIRDWVLKFNARGPEGLIDGKAPGQPSRLTDRHRAALAEAVERGPIPAVHGVVRWRIIDLCQWLWEEFQVSVSKQTLGRELRAMCYRKLSARPRHYAQTEGAIEAFEKTSLLPCRRLRTNGSCETIGSPIASLPATTTSSTTAATPGTSSSDSLGSSCRSECATGLTSSDQRVLV